ncbi:uncharacterized protein LOC135138143 [Zophobas morio]|uniref:uncharacterized protein LOC135138143 n=1 Tax=Zophobas morio TaxID=2755281 RepID=UPI003083637A
MVSFVRLSFGALILVTLTFEKIDTQDKLLDPGRDIRFFKGELIDIKENNIIVIICNCPTVNFHLILKNGYVKRYTFRSKTRACYTYEIGSTSEKTQVVRSGEVVTTAEDGLETMVLKCSSKYASWKILKTCWNGAESHPCRIDCPRRHCDEYDSQLDVRAVLFSILLVLTIFTAPAILYFSWIRRIDT